MNTSVKSLGIIVTLTVLLASSLDGHVSHGKNMKTSAKQLNQLERFLIRASEPEIPLDKILAQEQAADGENTVQDEYDGGMEWWNIELPLFLMQLNKLGDKVLFPSYEYQYEWYYCYLGYCSGFHRTYSFRNPVLKGVRSARLDGSVMGTQLRLHYRIPDVVASDPTFTYDDHDYGTWPPDKYDHALFKNATIFVKNFDILMTTNLEMGPNGLEASNLNIVWTMDDLRIRYESATVLFPDGRQEEWGPQEELWHEILMDAWSDDFGGGETLKEYTERNIKLWLNCFLSNGKNGGSDCNGFLDESLHRQSFAELVHAFGLNALNKARAEEY